MNAKRHRLLAEAVAPMLEPGERIEVQTIVNLKPVSLGRTMAVAAATAILSGGLLYAYPTRTPYYLSMTDRRMFVFLADEISTKVKEHVMTIPRAGLVRSEIKERWVNSSFVVSTLGTDQGVRLIFPLVNRKDRHVIAAAVPMAA